MSDSTGAPPKATLTLQDTRLAGAGWALQRGRGMQAGVDTFPRSRVTQAPRRAPHVDTLLAEPQNH